jgi:hypothetical protein
MRRGRVGVVVGLVVGLTLLAGLPLNLALSEASAAAPAAPTAPTVTHGEAVGPVRPPPPPLFCPMGYPAYAPLEGGIWPFDPNFYYQGSCPYIAKDEVHGTFSSAYNGSGANWSMPWTLPAQGPGGQENAIAGLYVGEVVSGDNRSLYNQSYAEVVALPSLNFSGDLVYSIQATVVSFANISSLDNFCGGDSLNLSWNDSYYCEFNDVVNQTPVVLFSSVPGGQSFAVTFRGEPRNTTRPVDIYVNETNGDLTTTTTLLDQNTTGGPVFAPAYATACPDNCELGWALSYGLGVGIDICPQGTAAFAYCDSYNGTLWPQLPPTTFGIPEAWNGATYGADYRYFSPESASGVCDTSPPNGVTVAACYEYTSGGGDGFYPYFSLTAHGLDFGTSQPQSVTSWGGPYNQYLATSSSQDLTPLVETHLTDSSLAGYAPTGSVVNVTLNVTDLGHTTGVTLAWSLAGGPWTTGAMTRTSGNVFNGAYLATIPSGANGTIRYQVNATGGSGLTVSSTVRTVSRGPLPVFHVALALNPPSCGGITFNDSVYGNGSLASVGPGPTTAAASGCYAYTFAGWQATPRLTLASPSNATTAVIVGGNGTLTATWNYVRPYENITVGIAPVGCGLVMINGVSYADGGVASVQFALPQSLGYTTTCGGYAFGGWNITGNLSVSGDSLVAGNNATLTATFVPADTTDALTFATNPTTCGGVQFGDAAYTNGEQVNVPTGNYVLIPRPCAHYGFVNFTATPGATIAGRNLSIAGATTVTENNYKLTEVFVTTDPSDCGGIVLSGVTYTNGADIAVENHSVYTVTAFSCAGHFLEGFTSAGGLTLAGSLLTVNGTGSLLVVSLVGTPQVFVAFLTTPARCGSVLVDGTGYTNGEFTSFAPDSALPIAPLPCGAYGFVGWTLSGLITISNGVAYLNGSGAITAIFGALVTILIDTTPSTCGATVISGVSYLDGSQAVLTEGVTYSIVGVSCDHYVLHDFETSPFVAIANNSFDPDGPSTITAIFVPIVYTVHFEVSGPGCGQVYLSSVPEGNGANVNETAGNYSLTATPCSTSTFAGFTSSGPNLSLAGNLLVVNGNGTMTAQFVPIPPVVTIGGPSGALAGGPALFFASVQVPVAANGYVYTWTFGDGTVNTTTSNTTVHVYASTGTYRVSVEVVDPFHRSANASTTITVVTQSSADYTHLLEIGLLTAGAAAAALVVIWFAGRPRQPPARPEPSTTSPSPPPAEHEESAPVRP